MSDQIRLEPDSCWVCHWALTGEDRAEPDTMCTYHEKELRTPRRADGMDSGAIPDPLGDRPHPEQSDSPSG